MRCLLLQLDQRLNVFEVPPSLRLELGDILRFVESRLLGLDLVFAALETLEQYQFGLLFGDLGRLLLLLPLLAVHYVLHVILKPLFFLLAPHELLFPFIIRIEMGPLIEGEPALAHFLLNLEDFGLNQSARKSSLRLVKFQQTVPKLVHARLFYQAR